MPALQMMGVFEYGRGLYVYNPLLLATLTLGAFLEVSLLRAIASHPSPLQVFDHGQRVH